MKKHNLAQKSAKKAQKRKKVLAGRKAAVRKKQEKGFKFVTWDQMDDMYQETAKAVIVNGRIVEKLLKSENVRTNLEQSPGAVTLVNSFTELTIKLSEELKAIREKQGGRTGAVDMNNPDEANIMMDLYSAYSRISTQTSEEYGQCAATLKALEESPAIFMNDVEAQELQDLNDKAVAMQHEATAQDVMVETIADQTEDSGE